LTIEIDSDRILKWFFVIKRSCHCEESLYGGTTKQFLEIAPLHPVQHPFQGSARNDAIKKEKLMNRRRTDR